MALGIDPKVDYAFKRVFGDERNSEILIHLINAILGLSEPIVSVEILNPFNERDFTEEKLTVLDIKARDQLGRLINVEMQLLLPQQFRGRILYYWAGLYRQQLGEGDGYERLRPAVSICLQPDAVSGGGSLASGVRFVRFRPQGLSHRPYPDSPIGVAEVPRGLGGIAQPLGKMAVLFSARETMEVDGLPSAFGEPVYRRAARKSKC